ncbi:single-stranded DNA-binding protein [Campylobacter corcagiensis]|uniref:Single-stranded DNA-binding protein n=1 Tax=Campylobacter corcagiensis TaxID=1448857 RepID=A0A7M1LGN7_9BACT|nr:single-stranded DNA-binding protein [Campylobacter corcagiensis]QKF65206.1 single-stranded DNA-binding protein [Campylobacter corcagiensis]QOQ86655.1 single-stranded DNA-binding protein [Campylobacter corcagiensis]
MNKVQLCGYLGRDFELRYSKLGNAVGINSLAISKRFKDNMGQEKERTEWIPIKLFGRTAEVANQYFKKGSQFLCSGELYTDDYVDSNGVTRYTWGVNVKEFYWLNNKREKEEVRVDTDESVANNRQAKNTSYGNLEPALDQEICNNDFIEEQNNF